MIGFIHLAFRKAGDGGVFGGAKSWRKRIVVLSEGGDLSQSSGLGSSLGFCIE